MQYIFGIFVTWVESPKGSLIENNKPDFKKLGMWVWWKNFTSRFITFKSNEFQNSWISKINKTCLVNHQFSLTYIYS